MDSGKQSRGPQDFEDKGLEMTALTMSLLLRWHFKWQNKLLKLGEIGLKLRTGSFWKVRSNIS